MMKHKRFQRGAAAFFVIALLFSSVFCAEFFGSEDRVNWIVRADEKNRDAVVCIQGDKVDEFSGFTKESGKSYNGMGTGIVIDQRGYIVTNYHVVEGIRKIQVMTYDRNQYIATLVARDPETDLAIIKIKADKPLKTITLGRSNDLMVGEYCMAIGNPYGYPFSVTCGLISGNERDVEVNDTLLYRFSVQTSTPINPGNSGGPLLNVDGEMIGINAAIRQGAECIAFAIPVDQVIEVAAKLIGELSERNAYLGLKIEAFDDEKSKSPSSERRTRILVDEIEKNSPAETAGFKEGDEIMMIGAFELKNKLDFSRALLELKSRDDLAFIVKRNDETLDLAATLASPRDMSLTARNNRNRRPPVQPNRDEVHPRVGRQPNLDDLVWENLGIRYEPMSKDEYKRNFAQYLSEHPYGGVVVKAVREGSQMAEKGVMPGDVIVGIHEWVTTSQNDVRYIAKAWPTIKASGNKVRLLLFRDNLPYFTEIPLK